MSWRDRELEEEITFHLEMETEKNRSRGMSELEARRAARRAFGGAMRVREEVRDLRRTRLLEDLVRDVAYALRSLRRAPAYALTTVVTIGLAVGVAAAMLTFVHDALLRPLPYADADRVVTLWEANLARGEDHLDVSPANFLDWQARTKSFASLGLLSPHGFDLRHGERMIALQASRVSLEFFPALGVTPAAGRLFEKRDYDPGAEPRVVLSHRLWTSTFNADRALIGRTLEVDGKPAIVLGVVPAGVDYPWAADLYAPLSLHPGEKTSRSGHWMTAVGRLRDGVSLDEARADLDRVALTLAREYPATNESLRVRAIPLRETLLGNTRRLLVAVTAAGACLLLLACANAGALALARGAARRRELAVRSALGATPGRLIRQLVTESALLNIAAGLLASAVALSIIVWMAANTAANLRRMDDVKAGAITFLALLATTVFSTLLSGFLPALRLVRSGLSRDLESSRRDESSSRSETRLQSALVAVQLALALLLLTGAGLLLRSLQKLTANDLGFDANNLATIQLYLYDLHPKLEERAQFVRTSLASMRALPGVMSAAATSALPFDPAMQARDDFEIIGRARRAGESLMLKTTAVTPEYFATLRIPLLQGRAFTGNDDLRSQRVAIVNEAAARTFWRGQSPVGSRIRVGVAGAPREWLIVGVAGTVRDSDYADQAGPEVYVPLAQSHVGAVNYVVRTSAAPESVLQPMQAVIWSLTPSQSITSAGVLGDAIRGTLQTRRFALALMSGFGLVALVISAVGLWGLLTYIATRRRVEMGVRLALGATPAAIERLFVRRGLSLSAAGIVAGLIVSAAFTRVLESFLYQTSSFDPLAISGVVATTITIAVLASWIPARRIASLPPALALRTE